MNVESFFGQKCSVVCVRWESFSLGPVGVLMSKIQNVLCLLKCC
jgi:hypothetical protein